MHRYLLLSACLILFFVDVNAATRDPGEHFFDQSLGNFSDELEVAREEGKKGVLIMFEMDECPFCHRMKARVLNQVEVQDYYKQHFLIYTVDIEGDVEISDFDGNAMKEKDFAFKHHKVRATPVFGFFDLEGNLITRFTGATNDAEEFLWLGEFVVDDHYKTTNFSRYKREKRRARDKAR
ncbi:MAG: thioredoxin [gamma proteobacterium symbiont of Ctena orbiculata]|uniref:Thioredoxin family protein n=1 Tax=Candidatus Thiodiazotropha taylori TaxID=2792791 RepID=A0A944M8U2_9GAMM|nr:thioredoxin family protein [Candidatus Thiodiazotropha taylori]PUB89967.1 MAG: thioredoxin [gamma proteobacterium symbiont of Ctena orbiculata]MBT2988912.1 thioredoxin family protein [Candidatus Thiodiazotropha taylori]MBT2996442.1 thioredoxin family protein [Candidatus Thiodiazotropha taylori]MBT3000124.1 thioredoxin family protein [Candidatus Thiodiazotropha taylori]